MKIYVILDTKTGEYIKNGTRSSWTTIGGAKNAGLMWLNSGLRGKAKSFSAQTRLELEEIDVESYREVINSFNTSLNELIGINPTADVDLTDEELIARFAKALVDGDREELLLVTDGAEMRVAGVCFCCARSSSECSCGAWDTPLEVDP